MATWVSHLPAFSRNNREAEQKALHAAAYVLQGAVKRNLRGGYTSGDFVTGTSIDAVTISPLIPEANGWAVWVGTNLKYNLWWEIGHFNRWTGKYERVEKWRPAMMDNRERIAAAYWRTYRREMKKWEAS